LPACVGEREILLSFSVIARAQPHQKADGFVLQMRHTPSPSSAEPPSRGFRGYPPVVSHKHCFLRGTFAAQVRSS